MRTLILLSALFLLSFNNSYAQDEAAVEKGFTIFLDYVKDWDIDGTMQMIYPKLFEIVPKEMMQAALERQKADTATAKIAFQNNKINKVSKIFTYEKIKYALVTYEYDMVMKMEPGEATDFAIGMMEGIYGKKNITKLDEGTIKIHLDRKAYAINDPAIGEWKYLEKKKEMEELTKKILPKKVMKKLK